MFRIRAVPLFVCNHIPGHRRFFNFDSLHISRGVIFQDVDMYMKYDDGRRKTL